MAGSTALQASFLLKKEHAAGGRASQRVLPRTSHSLQQVLLAAWLVLPSSVCEPERSGYSSERQAVFPQAAPTEWAQHK